MPQSNDITIFEAERAHLDRALESPKGTRIRTATVGDAVNLSQRMNRFRVLDRKQSYDMYDVGDERKGRSVYDGLAIRAIKVGEHAPCIEITFKKPLEVEEL